MKSLAILIALCLVLKTEAMEKTIDEIMEEANNDSMSYDLVMSGSSSNPTVRIERDILVSLDEYMDRQKDMMEEEKTGKRMKRKATPSRRWPNAIVPYEIATNTFTSTQITQINQAIADWNRETCLNFRPRSGEAAAVRFQNGQGCSSFVGRVGNVQPISLANGCRIKRIIVHEMGHAIGFNHEQSRNDRDRFVRIRTENIPQPVLFNFQKLPTSQVTNLGVPYDYRSVMHYGARDFSTNGQITVETLDTNFQNIIGRAPGLSFRDIRLANAMYNCADCSDMNMYCSYWAGQGYCATSRYMMMYCKKSCEICNAPKRCEDMGQSCGLLQQRGFCSANFFRSYMQANCAATCGFCRAGELLAADGSPLNSKASILGSFSALLMLALVAVWRIL